MSLDRHEPRIPASKLAEVWRALAPAMAQLPIKGRGFRLFWQRGEAAGFRDFHVGLGAHCIIGAHSLADVVLSGDPDVSQRHLLLLGASTPSGAPALRILDLRARFPIFLEGDRPHRSLRVHGPFALRLGSHVLCGFPLGEAPPEELPASEVEDRDKDASEPSVEANPPRGTYLGPSVSPSLVASGPYRRITRIEALRRPSTLVEVASSRPEGAHRVLVARRAGVEAKVALSKEDLGLGVLVGRAERCLEAGLRTVMTMSISRIHAILLEEEAGGVQLFDAASTNGTFVDGTRVRSALLGPGARVRLGSEIDVELA